MNPAIRAAHVTALLTALLIAFATSAQAATTDNAGVLVGHWRTTSIVFESPQDEHLVFKPDGTVENWIVTASSRSGATKGTWKVDGRILTLTLAGKNEVAVPFTMHEGQLVLPNVQNRRRFWDKLSR